LVLVVQPILKVVIAYFLQLHLLVAEQEQLLVVVANKMVALVDRVLAVDLVVLAEQVMKADIPQQKAITVVVVTKTQIILAAAVVEQVL
jgi:hypothetical protein